MEHIYQPDAAHWSTDDAPGPTSQIVPHEAEGLTLWPLLVDLWQCAALYGAMVSPVLIGDLGGSMSKVRVRLVVPGLATHAQIYVRAVGQGSVYIEEQTSGFAPGWAAQVPCQGNGSSTSLDEAGTFIGSGSYETPTSLLQRLALVPDGDSPFYFLDLDIWKDESPQLTVLSVALRLTRIDPIVA
ncbi:MAG: hypothetical protein AMXMBFR64_05150 [Myxococcales bacterium]